MYKYAATLHKARPKAYKQHAVASGRSTWLAPAWCQQAPRAAAHAATRRAAGGIRATLRTSAASALRVRARPDCQQVSPGGRSEALIRGDHAGQRAGTKYAQRQGGSCYAQYAGSAQGRLQAAAAEAVAAGKAAATLKALARRRLQQDRKAIANLNPTDTSDPMTDRVPND
jgi:hypothetical protein